MRVVTEPPKHSQAITPHATDPIKADGGAVRRIYVGGAGPIVLRTEYSSSDVTLAAVPVGTMLEIGATHVRATGTTATNLVALW